MIIDLEASLWKKIFPSFLSCVAMFKTKIWMEDSSAAEIDEGELIVLAN